MWHFPSRGWLTLRRIPIVSLRCRGWFLLCRTSTVWNTHACLSFGMLQLCCSVAALASKEGVGVGGLWWGWRRWGSGMSGNRRGTAESERTNLAKEGWQKREKNWQKRRKMGKIKREWKEKRLSITPQENISVLNSFAFLSAYYCILQYRVGVGDWMIMLGIDLFSLYLGVKHIFHDLSISVPGDLSSRFGSRGSAGEVVRCVGLQTHNRATLHHRVRGGNCKTEQTYHSKTRRLITAPGEYRGTQK